MPSGLYNESPLYTNEFILIGRGSGDYHKHQIEKLTCVYSAEFVTQVPNLSQTSKREWIIVIERGRSKKRRNVTKVATAI